VKVPHIGWNELHVTREHPLVAGIEDGDYAYFVHSYCATAGTAGVDAPDRATTVASCTGAGSPPSLPATGGT